MGPVTLPLHGVSPVPPDVQEYRVGSYQVCDKWLKHRKDRRLDLDDIRTYCRTVTAIGRRSGFREK